MKISAKTSARTKMQKAECHHGFSHVLRSTWNFARMFAEGVEHAREKYAILLLI